MKYLYEDLVCPITGWFIKRRMVSLQRQGLVKRKPGYKKEDK